MAEFNLVDKPWIPCIDSLGGRVEYGIGDTLLKGYELREICDDSPLVTVAIHRMLLAILYRAYEGPSDMAKWKALYEKGRFDAGDGIGKYLDNWHDRFYLLDDEHPFMQVAGLDLNKYNKDGSVKLTKGQNEALDGMMRLAKEAPDKGGRVLFDHRVGTEMPDYEPELIARMLLAAQSFSGTGIPSAGKVGCTPIDPYQPKPDDRRYKAGCTAAPCVDGLCLWLQGGNLFQTLMLNLVPLEIDGADLPAWEDQYIVESAIRSWSSRATYSGVAQRFAPQSRFIRVVDRQSMFFTNGLKTGADSDDPMKAYSRPDDKSEYQAVKLRTNKAAWRDAHALFALGSSVRKSPASLNHLARLVADGVFTETEQPRANLVGLATDKDKALLWRHERMPVPVGILGSVDLTERLGRLIAEAEAVGAELSRGLFWSATNKKTIRTEPVGRIQAIADLVLTPSLEMRLPGILRTSEGRAPEDAHNKAALDLSKSLNPLSAYWARLESHFFALLEDLPNDWDTESVDWKPDDQQAATNTWRKHVKDEARRALEESIRSLGTTARAIQAVARIRTDFNDDDLKPQPRIPGKAGGKAKGGKKK